MPEPYCRLYIDTDDDRASVQAAIDAYVPQAFEGTIVDALVFKNTGFERKARARRPYDPIGCSPLTAEVGTGDEPSEHVEPFQVGLVRLVINLRARGYFVTASCDFEERVAKETGWNWSDRTPEPPGR